MMGPPMLHSAEIRWFFEGSLPEKEHLIWFFSGQADELTSGQEEERRTDRYLVFPGCESVGVKERQRKFEIKTMRGSAETASYPGGISGRLETWVKWSYGGPAALAWVAALRSETSGWIEIAKNRWTRKYSLDSESLEEVHAKDAKPAEGCNIELTGVEAAGSHWWTFGLEAFGDQQNVRSNLAAVANHFLTANRPPFKLGTVGSVSYPVWMSGLPTT